MARIGVVGAGMAGLTAARGLVDAGHDVVVLDKGHRPGGRMATRHLDGATFDHGAQFFTTKSDWFADLVSGWRDADLATTWFHGGPDRSADASGDDPADGHPRYRGTAGMRTIPEHLATTLGVRCGVTVTAVVRTGDGWRLHLDEQSLLDVDALVLTPPAPQVLRLLRDGDVAVDDELGVLRDVSFDPCWAALVVPDGTPDLPDHGALRLDDHPLHWVSDNVRKGISAAPSVTLHASPDRTRELFDRPADEVGAALLADAADLLTGQVARTHRWRFSAPTSRDLPTSLLHTGHTPLAVAGDAFAGGRVEGAALSGRDAARRLLDVL